MLTGLLLVSCQMALASGVTVSPSWVDAEMPDGRAGSFAVTVQNQSPTPMAFETRVDDFWYNPDTMKGEFPPAGTTPLSLAGQLSVFPPRLIVPSGGSAEFSIIVEPDETWNGSKFASLTVTSVPYNNEATGMRLRNRLAFRLPVLLRSASDTNYEVTVDQVVANSSVETDLVAIEFTLTNTGDTHVRPRIIAVLQANGSDEVLASLDSRAPYFFLPGQRASFSLEWPADVSEGTYSIIGAVRFGDTGAVPFNTSMTLPSAATPDDSLAPTESAPL